METTIDNGCLVIRVPLETPRPSSTGKTLIVATTGGNVVTEAKLPDGRNIVVGLNAYVRPLLGAS